jgi:hypothetical protein
MVARYDQVIDHNVIWGHTTISVSVGRCIQKCRLRNHSFAIWGLHCLPDSKEMRVCLYNEYY